MRWRRRKTRCGKRSRAVNRPSSQYQYMSLDDFEELPPLLSARVRAILAELARRPQRLRQAA
ncbi:hypothetical protein FEV16_12075 [Methylocystis sp. B8]|nr:hypothetical protein FEV16_12075 [Methylocystis sp. B8]